LVSLTSLIAFWRKKDSGAAPDQQRIIPLPPSLTQQPAQAPEPSRTTSAEDADRAKEALKVLRLERQILATALSTIYESFTKGVIGQAERDRLIGKYKVDLNRLEKSIDENQRIVDLFELEAARDKLVKEFNSRLSELDQQIKSLRSGEARPISSERVREQHQENKPQPKQEKDEASKKAKQSKPPAEEQQQQQEITDAEKRVEQIRDEILKAMDRLEQIEAEG